MFKTVTLALFVIALSMTSSMAATWSGKVIGVTDGDTITVLLNRESVKIRFYGIDTPEGGQEFGKQATKQMKKLVSRKTVEVTDYDTDRYGRSVSVVKVGDLNVNRAMIESGYAWQYQKYCKKSFCREWLQLEEDARAAKIGLWKDKNAVPPWEWRKQRREAKSSYDVGGAYHGNSKTHSVHSNRCKYFNCKHCTVPFESLNEAINAGYRPHSKCTP